MAPSAPSDNPKQRIRLSVAQKLEIVDKLSNGTPVTDIVKEYGCCVRTVRAIKQKKTQLLERGNNATTSLHTKTIRTPRYPLIEGRLMEFIPLARSARMPVNSSVLQMKALKIRDAAMWGNTLDLETKKLLERFTASDAWVSAFMKRNGLRTIALHGEEGVVEAVEEGDEMAQVRSRLGEYSVENIYAFEETMLFYKVFPKRGYVTSHANRTTVRETRHMKAADRVSAYICANAAGTQKLPIAMIGTEKKPRCFRSKPPSLPYDSQKSAWSDTVTFRRWFNEVFLPFVRQRTSEKVLLLMDNFGPHATDLNDRHGQVSILTLPPDYTPLHQPMHTGIIPAWKLHYRQELLRRIVGSVEYRESMRRAAANWNEGTKGIDQGDDPHLSDVCEIGLLSWGVISEETIAQCWLRCDILPPAHQAGLIAIHGEVTRNKSQRYDPEYKKLCKLFHTLRANLSNTDYLAAEMEDVSDREITRWANIEETEQVKQSVVNDMMEQLERDWMSGDIRQDNSVAGNELEAETENVVEGSGNVPSPNELIEMFRKVEEVAVSSEVVDAIHHLQRAKRSLMDAHAEARSKRRRTVVGQS